MPDNLLDIQVRHPLRTASGPAEMDIHVQVPRHSITALTGPSGAGKTTLLRQIAGLSRPEHGRIIMNEQTWLDDVQRIFVPPQQRHIGFVFQDYALFPNMTVLENLQYGLSKNADAGIIDLLLKETELTELADRRPVHLSGGQQQRVALARALVRKPEVLLLDEPFNALDFKMRAQVQMLLLKFHAQFQCTTILVTHDVSEIFRLADQVMVLENGKVTAFGTPEMVFAKNENAESGLKIYGKVLQVLHRNDVTVLKAWIDHKLRTITLPPGEKLDFNPDTRFVMHYDEGKMHFEILQN